MNKPPNFRDIKCENGLEYGDPNCTCDSCERCKHIEFRDGVPDDDSVFCKLYKFVIDGHGWVKCDSFKKYIEPYGQTKHFTYMSQHEEGVIREMVEFYLKYEDFEWLDIMKYYKETAEELLKEIEDSPCFCGTCKAYREGKLKLDNDPVKKDDDSQ